MEDGTGITFRIYDDKQREITSIGAEVKDGTAETVWTYYWNGEELKEKPKFTFEVTANCCKPVKSEECEISAKLSLQIIDELYKTIGNLPIEFSYNDQSEDVQTDSNGLFEKDDLIPGHCQLLIKFKNDYKRPDSQKIGKNTGLPKFEYDKQKELNIDLNTYFHCLIKIHLNNELWSK